MANAGKIMIMPKGAYDASASYEVLDLVTHSDKAWVAKRNVTGVEPSEANSADWFLMADDNVSKLGGKDASEYALAEQIKSNSLWNELTTGFDLNNALGRYRTTNDTTSNSLVNKPSAITDGEIELEFLPADSNHNYGTQILLHRSTSRAIPMIYARIKARDVWGEWQTFATTADLANYLPNDYALAKNLSIGYLNMLGCTGFTLKDVNGKSTGHVGYVDGHFHLYNATASSEVTLLDTGNKPTGTYTGNGSATERKIATGGIGSVCVIYNLSGGNQVAFIGLYGGIGKNISDLNAFGTVEASFANGVLTLQSTNALVNADGHLYSYYVL